ncbi:retrovirus-related Pol polyprotein from transposon 17.6 [Trichonephila clavipes]|nr:retrovirus-related Pol polyprotein from transposon 17.6 [Trichonephila clavipes]
MACEIKLLESEATTGFFVLLREQGNKAVLDWVMKEGLIPSRYECPKCKKDMRLVERKGTIDGFEWRCRVLSKENPHFVCRSVRKEYKNCWLKNFGEKIAVCADTGASCTNAGKMMFNFIQEHDITFTNKRISFMMVDGIRQTIMALSTVVDLYNEGKVIPTEFLALPEAKRNKTLLGLDFLNTAGIVLDVQGGKWHFSGKPSETARKFDILLDRNEACFQPGGEPTPFIEHRIDTGDHPPIATSPYRMNSVRKEVLREQIEELLRQNVIEECESPYAAPVVLVPKPNGKVHLCVDYRKLNSVAKVDA